MAGVTEYLRKKLDEFQNAVTTNVNQVGTNLSQGLGALSQPLRAFGNGETRITTNVVKPVLPTPEFNSTYYKALVPLATFQEGVGNYLQNRVVQPIQTAKQRFQSPSLPDRVLGGVDLAGAALNLSPLGIGTNLMLGTGAGLANSVRTGRPLAQAIGAGITQNVSPTEFATGSQNPVLNLVGDVVASNPKAAVSAVQKTGQLLRGLRSVNDMPILNDSEFRFVEGIGKKLESLTSLSIDEVHRVRQLAKQRLQLPQAVFRKMSVEQLVTELRGTGTPNQTTLWGGGSYSSLVGRQEPRAVAPATPNGPSAMAPTAPKLEDALARSGWDVKNKVGLLDYLRTPDRVLQKIGLGNQAKQLRQAYDTYLQELPREIEQITAWSKRVTPEGNQRIFQYLDGKPVALDATEQQVAQEIRGYLQSWADRLGLPKEKRITNYITHIFDRDLITKEFGPDLAKLIQDKVPGSVYDPFTEQRLGKLGYVEDTWRALDAYVKRAVRKVNMDPALQQISSVADQLEQSQYTYVKRYLDKVNMRPGEVDNLVDNSIKQLVGYRFGQRPTAVLTKNARQMIYRGTLGLNVGSALKNLTQGANTYAKLGEKYTVLGYTKALKALLSGDDELERVGALNQDVIEDRTVSAVKSFWQHADRVLFALFEGAERVNRGAAYYGAKAKALAQGMGEEQAIAFATDLVRQTQFTFGRVDTPVALQNDLVKVLTQFQSYNVKQTEFLVELLKHKEYAGLARWLGASLVMIGSVGQLIGMKPTDLIPSFRVGGSPLFTLGNDLKDAVLNRPDQFGNPQTPADRLQQVGRDLVPFIPGGVQGKKTVTGLSDVSRGYTETSSGRVKFPVSQSTSSYLRAGLFGTNNLPEAQQYREDGRTPLGDRQGEALKQDLGNREAFYQRVLEQRATKQEETQAREELRQNGNTKQVGEKLFYVNEQGQVRAVPLNRPLYTPQLTGQPELDKLEYAKQRASITARQKDVQTLFRLGRLSAEDAEQELTKLKAQATAGQGKRTGRKPRKLTIRLNRKGKTIRIPKLSRQTSRVKKLRAVRLVTPRLANPQKRQPTIR